MFHQTIGTSKKRSIRKASSISDGSNVDAVEDHRSLITDLFDGTVYGHVDPIACIPFTTLWEPSDSGMSKLMQLYDKNSMSTNDKISNAHAIG